MQSWEVFSMSNQELTRRAQGELRRGESILYCGRQFGSGFNGMNVFLMIFGVLWSLLFGAFIISESGGFRSVTEGAVVVFIALMGLVFAGIGYYRVFITAKNYTFVTNQRLCIRGRIGLSGQPLNHDILVSSMEDVYIEVIYAYRGVPMNHIAVKIKNEKDAFIFYSKEVRLIMSALKTARNQQKNQKV